MEIIKLDIVGSYYYKPEFQIPQYPNNNTTPNNNIDCVICKKSLYEPSYEITTDKKNLKTENELVVGKCGHIFHGDCLALWLDQHHTCPIDNVKWCFHKILDTTTNFNSNTN